MSIINDKIAHQKSSITPDTILDSAIVEVNSSKNLCSTDTARHEQLRNKKVIVVCCGTDGLDSKKYVFMRLHDLGIHVYLVEEKNNSLALSLEKEGIIKYYIQADMSQRPAIVEEIIVEIKAIQKKKEINEFDGVTCFWDDAVTLSIRIQHALGVRSLDKRSINSIRAVDIAHDKNLTREVMRAAGLPTPKSMLIKSYEDAKKAIEFVGVPGVIKPISGAASLGVQKVELVEEMIPKYERELEIVRELYHDGELMSMFFGNNSHASVNYFVYEEYLEGDEVDVDIILDNGIPMYAVVADDWPQIQPWFTEMGNNCPSVLSKYQQDALRDMAIESLWAMGFTNGVFHVELKNTPDGPRLIEVNPRMGGGPVWRMHRLAYGVDLIAEQLCISCGVSTITKVPKAPVKYVSCSEKFFEKSMETPQEFRDLVAAIRYFPNVVEAVALVKTNEKIIGIEDGVPTRTARFLVLADSAIEAQEYARKLLEVCEIPELIRLRQS